MSKKWYTSKTVWVNVVGALAIYLQNKTGNVVIDEAYQLQILACINLILRTITKEAITW